MGNAFRERHFNKKTHVWTLHDMWAFSGAEHLSYKERWKDGYSNNKISLFLGPE